MYYFILKSKRQFESRRNQVVDSEAQYVGVRSESGFWSGAKRPQKFSTRHYATKNSILISMFFSWYYWCLFYSRLLFLAEARDVVGIAVSVLVR